ncbi:copper transporter [Rhodococcus sp. NPDC003382]|uniref:copper transporter n=2 Tax=Rhodococcus TaxID=1827 RepID=UPI0018CF7B9C|nr:MULTISPECIES: copper transporter [unclassified Rhodococcus (in: high G+C Gram-positive bacteria)]MBH0119871.1 copper transporter [Rhodococcus sp. CX]MCK8675066.1 copper transporter [Rhodococcus sp. HM1]
MISLRQHAVSIAAIFLALAVGIVLGSGLLSSSLVSGLRDDKARMRDELQAEQDRNSVLTERLNAADGFDAAVAGRVVRDTLAGRTVLMVAGPDADPADLDAVVATVEAAGAAVTGRVSLTESFVDAAGADLLRTTVTNVVPAGVQLQTGAVDQGSLAGDLLGAVLLVDPGTGQPRSTPEERTLALTTLRSAGFVSFEDGTVEPAQAAIVVTGDGSGGEEGSGNRGALLARFAAIFDTRGAGTVLAGRPGAATGNGPLAVVRADTALSAGLSTVDNLDREAGRITTVLALQEQLAGGAGRYGTGPGAGAVTVGSAAR